MAKPTAGVAVAPAIAPAVPAPAAAITGFITAVEGLLDPFTGGNPTVPVTSPFDVALLAYTRRATNASSTTTAAAQTTTASLTAGLPVDTTLVLADAIITGDPGVNLPTGNYTYTVANAPSAGGKITFLLPTDTGYAPGKFTYLPDVSVLSTGTETFGIRVSQVTQFDQFVTGIPIIGLIASPLISTLQTLPILSDLLAPIIGVSTLANFTANPSALNTLSRPLAYTAKITSFDGVLISTNFYPASTTAVLPGDPAATILNPPGLGYAGSTDPFGIWSNAVVGHLTPGIETLRDEGYNVITWDPRGEFDSGGVLQLDSPAFEGQDVKSIITWAMGDNTAGVDNPYVNKVQLDMSGDPLIGMVGGSYGGGIQLVAAGIDPRIDAIVPGIAWNSLPGSLYPDSAFKTSYASLLLLSLITTGARINNQIYLGIATGDLLGWLSQTSLAVLGNSGPDFLLDNVNAPTLFIQGTSDVLFPLEQALQNSLGLPATTIQKTIWYCGGHGPCLNPQQGTPSGAVQDKIIMDSTLAWLDKYVRDGAPVTFANFQWVDQNGQFYKSALMPTDGSFNNGAITGASAGGLLGIAPLIGGSGPSPEVSLPYSLGLAAPAGNAINVPITAPVGVKYIAGAPTVSFDYQGLGTSRFVYGQIVDENTGLVVGNIVTPIPVTLDGRSRSVTVSLNDIAYTIDPSSTVNKGDKLKLQITSSATSFENFTAFGVINISNVSVSIPTINPANVTPEP